MPRKPSNHVESAAQRLKRKRGMVHVSPAHVLKAARKEDFWNALLDGRRGIFWSKNGKKARRKVVKRHAVKPKPEE